MRIVLPLVFLLVAGAVHGLEAQTQSVPLFAEREPLLITLEADFHQLRRDRDEENEERDGMATLHASEPVTVPVKLRTRGRFRLQARTCEFPPLRLNFPKSEVEGTTFEGQDKLKLVTHCRNRDGYEENTLEEYLVYRLMNLLTDRSFQVRLARLTYVDVTGREDTLERWGFLLESEEALAERLGGELIDETEEVHPREFRGRNTGLPALFQFMVGNTDWSMGQSHNFVLVRTPTDIIPVPYDFDWTGFVNAPYARPDASLGTRNVRQRVYREFCRADIDHAALFDLFRARRPAMEAEIRQQVGLDDDRKEDALEYLADFFEILDDERKSQREIIEGCRKG